VRPLSSSNLGERSEWMHVADKPAEGHDFVFLGCLDFPKCLTCKHKVTEVIHGAEQGGLDGAKSIGKGESPP